MKNVRLTVEAKSDRLGDIIEALQSMGAVVTLTTSTATVQTASDDDDEEVPQPVARKRNRAQTMVASVPVRRTGGNTGPKVYTPAVTQREIDKTLAGLRKNTLGAFVLADISKHPGTSKRDIIARLTPKLAKHGLSPESIDNVVWNFQNKRIVKSVDAE